MKLSILEIIQQNVHIGKTIDTSVIEYNFDLPKHKDIKKDKFFGVKAKFNPDVKEGTANLTYKM